MLATKLINGNGNLDIYWKELEQVTLLLANDKWSGAIVSDRTHWITIKC
ncbi:hypothetical protein [Nostoc sp.]